MLQTVFGQLGRDYSMWVMLPARATLAFMSGIIDETVSVYKTPALSKAMYFSNELLSVDRVALECAHCVKSGQIKP